MMEIILLIDFGSTYTLVSVYKHNTKVLETLALDQGTPCIPSVVSYDEYSKRYEYGRGAKSQTGRKGARIFRAFKMLLTEQEGSSRLEARGFDSVNTPEKISSIFLEGLLKKVLADLGEDKIGNIVVGVPEIWNEDFKTVDGRSIVRNIFKEMDFVENVQVVSEPAAASAFFAYNYQMNKGVDFHGNILFGIVKYNIYVLFALKESSVYDRTALVLYKLKVASHKGLVSCTHLKESAEIAVNAVGCLDLVLGVDFLVEIVELDPGFTCGKAAVFAVVPSHGNSSAVTAVKGESSQGLLNTELSYKLILIVL